MKKTISKNPLVKMIAEDRAKDDVWKMLLNKSLPINEEEYLETLSFAINKDQYKEKAKELFKAIDDKYKKNYVSKKEININVAYNILQEALEKDSKEIMIEIINNNIIPNDFLAIIASQGSNEVLEVLISNEIRVIAFPELIDFIKGNSKASGYVISKLQVLYDYYLKQESQEISPQEVLSDKKNFEKVQSEVKKIEEDSQEEEEKETQTKEEIEEEKEEELVEAVKQINRLSVPEKIKKALTGSKTDRMILIRDNNKMVSLSVIESPKLSSDEVVAIARNKSLPTEIIAKIAQNRYFTKNYIVMHELIQNPKTPLQIALGFLNSLHERDLRQLSRDKNANPPIRKMAINMINKKGKVNV